MATGVHIQDQLINPSLNRMTCREPRVLRASGDVAAGGPSLLPAHTSGDVGLYDPYPVTGEGGPAFRAATIARVIGGRGYSSSSQLPESELNRSRWRSVWFKRI